MTNIWNVYINQITFLIHSKLHVIIKYKSMYIHLHYTCIIHILGFDTFIRLNYFLSIWLKKNVITCVFSVYIYDWVELTGRWDEWSMWGGSYEAPPFYEIKCFSNSFIRVETNVLNLLSYNSIDLTLNLYIDYTEWKKLHELWTAHHDCFGGIERKDQQESNTHLFSRDVTHTHLAFELTDPLKPLLESTYFNLWNAKFSL